METKIIFKDKDHEKFFIGKYKELGADPNNHDLTALIYLLGMYDSTRDHFHLLYDEKMRIITPDGLTKMDVTSSNMNVIRLAFNLYTGSTVFAEENGIDTNELSVAKIFRRNDCDYFVQALKLWNPSGFDR